MRHRRRLLSDDNLNSGELIGQLAQVALPLNKPADLDPLVKQIGSARYVLLGEASHGTSEYYRWRALISELLIREKGFSFVAVEGDWPDCYRINRFVKSFPNAGTDIRDVLELSWFSVKWNFRFSALAG